MSAKRELQILQCLKNSRDSFIPASTLSKKLDVSVRTIKTEINKIRNIAHQLKDTDIDSVSSKGYMLICDDEKNYEKLIELINNSDDSSQELNSQSMRVNAIIYLLLNTWKRIGKIKIMNYISVSESTLYSDVKEVKNILEKYDLKLIYDNKHGYFVEGSEINKRRCLAYENIYWAKPEINEKFKEYVKHISDIKETFVDICSKHRYKVSESVLESMIIHFLLTLTRIDNGFVITDDYCIEKDKVIEYDLAKEILEKYVKKDINLEKEINFFAINLHGKREYEAIYEIPNDLSNFINYALKRIKDEFLVDFSDMLDLKVALTLHFSPLLTRMENKMQLKNIMLAEIKKEFPFAFDIASFLSTLIFEKYHIEMSEDEMAYFTLYFNYGLENMSSEENGKKILIISSLRKSETILLRQRLLTRFRKDIDLIKFINPIEVKSTNIEDYDAIFTTERNDDFSGAATRIDIFPTEKDFSRIDVAINGYGNVDSIISKFSKDLFVVKKGKEKDEVINHLIKLAENKFHTSKQFSVLVKERERLSSTYFANGIAIPHPLHPITKDTFIAVCLLEEPIKWNEDHEASVVMMISTEQGNPKAFQIWQYLSEFTNDSSAVEEILEHKDFEHFIETIKKTLRNRF